MKLTKREERSAIVMDSDDAGGSDIILSVLSGLSELSNEVVRIG